MAIVQRRYVVGAPIAHLQQAVDASVASIAFDETEQVLSIDDVTPGILDTLDEEMAEFGFVLAPDDPDALQAAKDRKFRDLDRRTRQLIKAGFEYPPASGTFHSLSTKSQIKILAADESRNDPAFTYPVEWNSKNDMAKVTLADAATLHAFALTAIGTVRAVLDSGTALKNAVRAAGTIAGVDAVVDSR